MAKIDDLDKEVQELRKEFALLITRLQAFGSLPLEEYKKPAVDELAPGTQKAPRKESAKVKKFKEKTPF